MKLPRILFFIAGMAPTKNEMGAANKLGNVAFRNRSAIALSDKPEKCDFVAGEIIPAQYADKPVAESFEQLAASLAQPVTDDETADDAADDGKPIASSNAKTDKVPGEAKAKADAKTPPVAWKANV